MVVLLVRQARSPLPAMVWKKVVSGPQSQTQSEDIDA
jgi:hypothetical protein